jgi:hypothetical protein
MPDIPAITTLCSLPRNPETDLASDSSPVVKDKFNGVWVGKPNTFTMVNEQEAIRFNNLPTI